DFTPTTFKADFAKGTTFACQLATAVVYTSPILCWADEPRVYMESPSAAWIRAMPAVCDESRVLEPSAIGEVAVFARRSGEAWWLGVINGEEGRTIEVDLSFLGGGDGAGWTLASVSDVAGEHPEMRVEGARAFDPSAPLKIELEAGG